MKQQTTNTDDISQAQRQQASRSFIISAHNSKTNPNALQEWQRKYDGLINTHAVLELYHLAKDNAVKMANKTIVPNTAAEPAEATNQTRNTFINGLEENAIQILATQISQGKGYEIKLAELWSDKQPIYIHHASHQGAMINNTVENTIGADGQRYAIFTYGAPELDQQADHNVVAPLAPAM